MVFSTVIAKAKTYNVENVEIIEPYDLDFKKEIVIDKAFKSAFEILISRIINSDNIKSINFNNIDEIRTMVDSFLIQNEKFIENKYIAEFNILFNRKDILTFLNSKNITASMPKKKKILFLPLYIDVSRNELIMYSENKYYKKWNNTNNQKLLLEYDLLTEDLEDFEIIKKNLSNIENFNFDQVLQKYNKDEYIVSIFIKSKNNLKVLSKIKFKEQFSIINSSFEYKETLSATDKIINNLKISFENEWKKVNRINLSIKLPLKISIKSKDIYLINRFEKALNNSEFTFDYQIDRITSEDTVYKIIYNNTPDKFLLNFQDLNFKIDTSNEIWSIQ